MSVGWGRLVALLAFVGLLTSGCAWIDRVSVATDGGGPDRGALGPSISGDGRYVAFGSTSGDLVPGDTNGVGDVFVRDLQAGTTVRASVDTAGGDPDNESFGASISGDGRYVAFFSRADDLVPGDTNGVGDVFVRDLQAGTTVRASVDTAGGGPDGDSLFPSISGDARYVAFSSAATDLVPGDTNGVFDVFVRDLQAGTTVRASVDTAGGDPDAQSLFPSMSGDGRYVAFVSLASDLVPGDTNGGDDVFVRDLQAGTNVRASVDTAGGDPDNSGETLAAISADGRYVAFSSFAGDLVSGDTNGAPDIFVRDLQRGITTRASVDTTGADPDRTSLVPSISSDGRYVAFESGASDLVSGDTNGATDVFVRDRLLNRTIRLSQSLFHGQTNGQAVSGLSISPDSRYVAFASDATNLVDGDDNGIRDVFIKYARVVTVSGISPSSLPRGATNVAVTISGTGFEPGSTISLAKPSDEGGNITVTNVNVASDSEITAVFSVASDAPAGAWTVRVIHPPTALGAGRVAAGQCAECLQIT